MYKARVLKWEWTIKVAFSRDGRIVLKLFTEKLMFVTSEDEFDTFCKNHKIKFVDPKD